MSEPKVIGYQIVNSDGWNIHGEEDDPFALNSFDVLTERAVDQAREWVSSNPAYKVVPVRDGEVEEPEFVSDLPPAAGVRPA